MSGRGIPVYGTLVLLKVTHELQATHSTVWSPTVRGTGESGHYAVVCRRAHMSTHVHTHTSHTPHTHCASHTHHTHISHTHTHLTHHTHITHHTHTHTTHTHYIHTHHTHTTHLFTLKNAFSLCCWPLREMRPEQHSGSRAHPVACHRRL